MYKYNEVSPDIVQYHPQIYYSYHLSHKQDAILPWMSQKIWSPTTQTFLGTVLSLAVWQLMCIVISAYYHNRDI